MTGKGLFLFSYRLGYRTVRPGCQGKKSGNTFSAETVIVDTCLHNRRAAAVLARASAHHSLTVPAYYNRPTSLEDCTRYTVGRILSQFDLDRDSHQWGTWTKRVQWAHALLEKEITAENLCLPRGVRLLFLGRVIFPISAR